MPVPHFKSGIALVSLMLLGMERGALTRLDARTSKPVQESEEETRRPASAHVISAATVEFQKAVNGKAVVHNRCRANSKEIEIEETSEVVERDDCKIVLKTQKTTHPHESQKDSADSQQPIEFMIYADLSELTTPVLVEKQRFAQCDAGALDVIRVSSRTDPKQQIRVVRRSLTAREEGSKQTRKDLSVFFAGDKAARRAADALERAVKACGGKEWPDEDDLP